MELFFFQNLALFCFWFVIGVSLVVSLKQYKNTSYLNRSSHSPSDFLPFYSYFKYKNKNKESQKERGFSSLLFTRLERWRGGWANINQIFLSKVLKGKIHKSNLLGTRTPAPCLWLSKGEGRRTTPILFFYLNKDNAKAGRSLQRRA